MKTQDFQYSITTPVSATEAFNGINQVSAWWAKNTEGNTQNLNDVFTVRFGETWVTFRITEMEPGKKVVWTTTDCYLPWLLNKTEWTGTKVIFEISATGDQTTINFTHQGLAPQIECYNQCVEGWTEHLTDGLLSLLNTGVGQPA